MRSIARLLRTQIRRQWNAVILLRDGLNRRSQEVRLCSDEKMLRRACREQGVSWLVEDNWPNSQENAAKPKLTTSGDDES